MSEYSEKHSVARLIGSPPGYVGYDQGGLLTESVDQNPHSVLLFDEIEKSHPDLFNILLQVMDYGKLTDNNGKSVNFKNTILILTTNIGGENLIKKRLGFVSKKQKLDNEEEIKFFFKPEFRNRLDSIISFDSLSYSTVRKIIDKFINQLGSSLKEKNISIALSEDVKDYLVKNQFHNGKKERKNYLVEKIASISTLAFKGKLFTPIVDLVCNPFFLKTFLIRSEAPLITKG